MQKGRLGVSFHETFSLSRPALEQILEALSNILVTAKSRDAYLRETTTLGTRQVKAYPRYAFGAGLVDARNQLTPFGQQSLKSDPLLEQISTQWLMHYYLGAPH